MSYAELFGFTFDSGRTEVESVAEYRNSHRLARMYWQALAERTGTSQCISAFASESDAEPFWALASDPLIVAPVRRAFAMTFDRVFIDDEHTTQMVDDIRLAVQILLPNDPGHWLQLADDMASRRQEFAGYGLVRTSVVDDIYWQGDSGEWIGRDDMWDLFAQVPGELR